MSAPEKPKRKNAAVRDVKRMAGLERAASFMGGQAALADAIGMSAGLLRQKIDASRPVRDEELLCVATALSRRADEAQALADKLRAIAACEVS